MAKFLLEKGYEVFGTYRKQYPPNLWRLDELEITDRVTLRELDLQSERSCIKLLREIRPEEIEQGAYFLPVVYIDENVTFDASGSYDPDGSIVSYLWTFGDGDSAPGEVVYHNYSTDDVYTVTLQVTDDAGSVATDAGAIQVIREVYDPPVVNISLPIADMVFYNDSNIMFDARGHVHAAFVAGNTPCEGSRNTLRVCHAQPLVEFRLQAQHHPHLQLAGLLHVRAQVVLPVPVDSLLE